MEWGVKSLFLGELRKWGVIVPKVIEHLLQKLYLKI